MYKRQHYEGHKIIEIGAVEVINRRLTGNNFHVYLKPDRLVDPEAFGVHGIADEFLLEDVYKRQGLNHAPKLRQRHYVLLGRGASVSYTHLDVYKRQFCIRSSALTTLRSCSQIKSSCGSSSRKRLGSGRTSSRCV